MPDKKPKIGPSPLEQAARTGVIGGAEETAGSPAVLPSSLPDYQNASPPAPQPAGPPAFQPSESPAVQTAGSPEFQNRLSSHIDRPMLEIHQTAGIPDFQTAGLSDRKPAGTPARQKAKGPKIPKVNSEGWEQQTVYLPPDLRYRLRHYALATNQEISTIAMEALQEYLAKHWRG